MPAYGHPTGSRWTRFSRLVFATYGDTCWICFHGGARQVDHVKSVTEHPELMWALSNARPAHGAARIGNPCPVCSAAAGTGIHCNQLRGGYSVERARKIIAEKIARHGGRTAKRYGEPAEPGKPGPSPEGREW
jgi:hypothetical protein